MSFGPSVGPVPLEDQADVVGFPGLGDLGIDRAGVPVPELARLAIGAERAEDGLERAELAARAHHFFHLREPVVEDARAWLPMRAIGRVLPLAIAEHVLAGRIDVDPLEIAEIDRVGAGRPGAAEEVGIGHLEPEAAPAARGMAVEQAGPRVGDQGKGLLEVGDELLDKALPRGPLVALSAKTWWPVPQSGSRMHPDQVLAEAHPRARHVIMRRHVMIAAEARE